MVMECSMVRRLDDTDSSGLRQETWESILPRPRPTTNSLLSHHFHDHSLVPLPIELRVENALPRAEIQFACGDRHNHLMMDQQRLQMRVAVVFPGVVVFVVLAEGGQPLEPLVDVLHQSALMVVDIDS